MVRYFLFAFSLCAPAFAWTESVEFPWNTLPPQLWERELVWLKNIGIRHVSLPPGENPAQLTGVLTIVRRLGIEADLEGPIPPSLEPLAKQHGGPLTGPLAGAQKISLLQPEALIRSRIFLLTGTTALIWTDVEDTLSSLGMRPGAVSFGGQERPATAILRRNAQLAAYWASTLSSMRELRGAGAKVPAESITVKQFAGENGMSVVAVTNASAKSWTGDIRAIYPALKKLIVLPNVTVPAKDSAWLPVGVPLPSGFSPQNHLVYATAEITAIEYENGVLAMEFSSPGKSEAMLQLSRQPSGPLVAGGKPAAFDWDEHNLRSRLPIPATAGTTHRVRIGIAIEPPDSTAFFDTARVLLIGETNKLTAQYSSEAIQQRSRLVLSAGLGLTQQPGKQPLEILYSIVVPPSALHGDHANLTIEADGAALSHARPQLLLPVTMRFPDAVSVRVAAASPLQLSPPVIPVNQRSGREVTFGLRNNANEIRTFEITPIVAGLEFSPPSATLTVGASASRDIAFRVFPLAQEGMRSGTISIAGAATLSQPVRFLIVPPAESIAWAAEGFSFIESAKIRATFMGNRWIEFLTMDDDKNQLPAGGLPFEPHDKPVRLTDLELLLPKPNR